jgi:TRAP transporter 4TM/12TM fusion protein
VLYAFIGPWLPGILEHRGYTPSRFFTYVYTDQGILGPTTAISSTYIILFVAFAAFLQASRVGEYFVNFAFAAAGHLRGGPAKVAVFGSGLMGMINGTSAGNVVATGSLTIPLMKKVGYKPQTAGAIEAAASSGGQILPPIMGAGAFIMSEITGIPYTEIVVAAIIPALLYFACVFFNVDLAAQKYGMKGLPRDQLPKFAVLARQAYLFLPIIILIATLFAGYSVIRAGVWAMAAATVVSWLTPYRMGPRAILYAFEIATKMSLQLIAVCAAAGIIVGVIALTGIGTRFSSLLLGLAGQSQIVALFFAMIVAIILGMGMPTTAAYAVAASVIAPGLIQMGIQPLIAHFFIFYFAVMSAITPPVALAAYAGAAIAQSDPMKTSVEAFKFGLAAFVVPFMFFASPALLMQGTWGEIIHVTASAAFGVYLLSAAVQGWFVGALNPVLRVLVGLAALAMIDGGWLTDAVGLGTAAAVWAIQRRIRHAARGGARGGLRRQPGLRPRSRSDRRRRSSTAVRSPIETITRIVATARIAGLSCSRMPFHIWRGIVCWSKAATKSTTTTSSKEVTKAKSAPEITPGRISGMVIWKKVVVGEAPSDAAARFSDWSKPTSVAVTVMMTKGMPSVAWARMMPV